MFDKIEHEFVGTTRAYLPQGATPYAVVPVSDRPGLSIILYPGDTVDVLSAWTRNYLPPDAPALFYVRSRNTGQCTHVVAADLPLKA